MRRNSQLAASISASLALVEADVSTRRLEGWTLDGLGPNESFPLDEQVAHYLELSKLAGPGRGRNADLNARRLAARGFVCRRLRGALLRGFNIDEVGQPEEPLDLSTDKSADAAFERLDKIARGMSESISTLPLPMRRIIEKFRRNAYDNAKRIGEPGEVVFRSAIVNFMCLLLGGDLYDALPIAAMLDVQASDIEPDAVDFVNERLRVTTWNLDEAYRSAPLDQVAAMALWLRERAHLAVAHLGLETATESQLDDLAALFAPCVLCILSICARIDGAEEFITTLELPSGLAAVVPSTPPLSA